MSDEFVEPIGELPPTPPVSPGGHRDSAPLSHEGRITGEITAVHRRAGHTEPGHILDTSVGAQAHTEIVVQTDRENLDDLIGKRVVIHFLDS
jgi:hypothetical protein